MDKKREKPDIPFYCDFNPEYIWKKVETDADDIDYLLDRIKQLYLRKNALEHKEYMRLIRAYCRRLQELK